MNGGLHEEVEGKLAKLERRHIDLKKALEKAHGYAVFPSVGRAGLVIGAAHGKGEAFEKGKPIGFASLSQLTIGVQLGGQTFTEVLLFDSKEALEEFKRGPVTFTANASAVLVKAAASGTSDYKGITALAFSEGGELLEASLGGQKLTYISPDQEKAEAQKGPGLGSRIAAKFGRDKQQGDKPQGEQQQQQPKEEQASSQGQGEEQPQAPQG